MPDWLPKQQLYDYRGGKRVKLYQWLKEARGEHDCETFPQAYLRELGENGPPILLKVLREIFHV